MADEGKIFTLGREREKLHAATYVRTDADRQHVGTLIDIVHDVLEGFMVVNDAAPKLADLFVSGGGGVWEQTGSWIRKLTSKHPGFAFLWLEMAGHKSAKIRFRVAAFVNDMPQEIRRKLIAKFLTDSSAKVRVKIAGEVCMCPTRDVLPILLARVYQETDVSTLQELHSAIHAISSLPK